MTPTARHLSSVAASTTARCPIRCRSPIIRTAACVSSREPSARAFALPLPLAPPLASLRDVAIALCSLLVRRRCREPLAEFLHLTRNAQLRIHACAKARARTARDVTRTARVSRFYAYEYELRGASRGNTTCTDLVFIFRYSHSPPL